MFLFYFERHSTINKFSLSFERVFVNSTKYMAACWKIYIFNYKRRNQINCLVGPVIYQWVVVTHEGCQLGGDVILSPLATFLPHYVAQRHGDEHSYGDSHADAHPDNSLVDTRMATSWNSYNVMHISPWNFP